MPGEGLFASIAPAIVQSVGNVGSGLFSLLNQRSVNKANFKMAEWQNARNIENWQMQNEYNSPANQMQRLKDAGLNPNLVYGNGSVVGNSANAPASVTVPKMEAYQMPQNMFGSVGDVISSIVGLSTAKKNQAEIKNIVANTALTAQQTASEQLHTALQGLALNKEEQMRPYYEEMARNAFYLSGLTNEDLKQTIANKEGQYWLLDEQIAKAREDYIGQYLDNQLFPLRQDLLEKTVETEIAKAKAQDAAARASLASANASNAQAGYYNQLTRKEEELLQHQITSFILDNGIKAVDFETKDIERAWKSWCHKNHLNPMEPGYFGFIQKVMVNVAKKLGKGSYTKY